MVIDGKQMASDIYGEIRQRVQLLERAPRMTAVTCAPNFETQKYLNLKKRKANDVGIALNIVELDTSCSTEEVVACIQRVAEQSDGVVVQLPFPSHVDRSTILGAVPPEKDPDAFGGNQTSCVSPVVASIREIAERHDVTWQDKKVAVVGHGVLVGQPAAKFAAAAGAKVTVLTEESEDVLAVLQTSDMIISGIGKPGFITPEMVADGVAVFDAGTSEDGGELRGDVHQSVADKASLFTPVPGGIGPLTVAMLFRNLLDLIDSGPVR